MSTRPHVLSVADWHTHNADHLSLALAWLRLRLATAARSEGTGVDDEVAAARRAVLAAERTTPPPTLALLGRAFDLTRFEQDVVLLCAAMALDTRVAGLCAEAQHDARMPYPTFALALTVLDDPDWAALAPSGVLRSCRLVECDAGTGEPLTTRPLSCDERVVHFLKGLNVLDARLARLLRPVVPAERTLPPTQARSADEIDRAVGTAALVQVVGRSDAGRRTIVAEVAGRQRLLAHELPAALLPTTAAETHELATLWRRESRLLPIALLVAAGADPLTPAQARAVRALVEPPEAPVFLGAGEVCDGLADISAVHDVGTPTPAEQRTLWLEALGADQVDVAGQLAAELDLDVAEIEQVAQGAKRDGDGDLAAGAWSRGKALRRPQLDALAERIRPVATWADIVLPDEPTRLLRALAGQARHRAQVYDTWGWRERTSRGLGITALFTGESGTGKTMAAEVLATDLGLDLYRIDLSGVVSKYVGETEKNLRRLFDAAEAGGVVLFFDEADALFGKRSEVRDSHDRYANIEVGYLLQRMESYRGLAILATNLRSALDPAFTRRLRFVVPFPLPARAERELIWRRAFPPQVPTCGIDEVRLSRLGLSGALIHSIALNASFAAAAAGGPVTMDLLLDAARMELRKADRSVSEVTAL
ncbi:ATP-binding protein [Intrasporangium sp.]|uniref:ATP-binding protein n=1 Tax=Intrasporangium sp. TaxID=1925024 RepID=UPI003221F097